ncbi:hypothetical protein [Actinopolyspora mortivallis]|uniref:hypothetical protein n=1 Tax=Actinopolyspora mortivallis TaxID=33906 RepID=UPI00037E5ABF|nr:hypothetical protein [Actinopolyspora mortivallis]
MTSLIPLVAGIVVLIGVSVALLTERLCHNAGAPMILVAFASAGIVAGVVTSLLFTGGFTHQFLWPAIVAAVVGRAGAGLLAARPRLLVLVLLLTVTAPVGSVLIH